MQLPAPIANAWRWMQDHVPNFAPDQLMTSVSDAAKRLVGTIASRSGAIIGGLAMVLLDLIVTLFALFFVLRDGRGIVRFIRAVLPFEEARRERVMREIGDLIYASVIAGLAVAAMQGFLGGITFWILGLRAPVVWGTVMALFALIPVAGAWVVWVPVAIYLLVTGDVTRAIVLFVVGDRRDWHRGQRAAAHASERTFVDEWPDDVRGAAGRRGRIRFHRSGVRSRGRCDHDGDLRAGRGEPLERCGGAGGVTSAFD